MRWRNIDCCKGQISRCRRLENVYYSVDLSLRCGYDIRLGVALSSCDGDFWIYRRLLPDVLGVVHLFTREARDTLMENISYLDWFQSSFSPLHQGSIIRRVALTGLVYYTFGT
jgi:hypothetical protein